MVENVTTNDAPKRSLLSKIKSLSKKAKIIIAAGAVVLLGGGGAFAYAAIQSPEATVGLAFASAFAGPHPSGNLDIKAEGAALNGDASIDIFTADTGSEIVMKLSANVVGQPVGATLNVVSAKSGDIYLNLADFDTLGSYLTNSGMLSQSAALTYGNVLRLSLIHI